MLKSPVGTLTFLMTDIEGSTGMWEEYPDLMPEALVRHEQIILRTVEEFDGYLALEQGEGDSTFSIFKEATQAARAADAIRQRLALECWPEGRIIRVRMGLHSGVADLRNRTYYGRAVNRAARVRAVAHGGQVLMTRATRELLDPKVYPNAKDHGLHRLKDLLQPEHLFELPAGEEFPPPASLNHRPNNLPVQVTSFIGRTADIEQVRQKLAAARVVTLQGPGGAGKTRLALQVAAELLDEFPDGVYLVELQAAQTLENVWEAVSGALRLNDRDLTQVQNKRILLLLDNCEHIVGDAARVVRELVGGTSGLHVLATSRQSLRLRGELRYEVKALSLPPVGGDLNACAGSEAVQLLLDRAEAKIPDFRLTEENCQWIGKICRRLDGIPLALELAAPRLSVLSPEQLLSKLEQGIEIISSREQDVDPRHRNLRVVLDASYALLDERQKWLFAVLAAFPGGWSIETLEFVLGDAVEALEQAERFVDRSLFNVQELASGQKRFNYLETVRQYALGLLSGLGLEGEAAGLLVGYMHQFALAREVALGGEGQAAAAAEVELELANLRAAMNVAGVDSASERLEIAVAIHKFWIRRGMFEEGRKYCDSLLARATSVAAARRAQSLNILGVFAWYQGDLEFASARINEALTIWQEIGDRRRVAIALNNMSLIAVQQHDLALAKEHLQRCLEVFDASGEDADAAQVCINLGVLHVETRDPAKSVELFHRARETVSRTSDTWTLGLISCNLAEAYEQQGRRTDALNSLIEGLTTLSGLKDVLTIATALPLVAEIAFQARDFDISATLLAAADQARATSSATTMRQVQPGIARLRAELEKELTQEQLSDLRWRGQVMAPEQVVEEALAACRRYAKTVMKN